MKKVAENPRQDRGKRQKTICPSCGEYYMQTAYVQEQKKAVRIGLFCRGCKTFKAD